MSKKIKYKRSTIFYDIVRKNVKNINIRVQPTGLVIVSANEMVPEKVIELLIIKRAEWILKTIDKYSSNIKLLTEPNLKFIDGENFTLLGKNLRIKKVQAEEFKISFDNNYLYVFLTDNRGIKAKFKKWYDNLIASIFLEISDNVYKSFKKYDLQMPQIQILTMTTRWGTCNKTKNLILLNKHLIKAPKHLIEYVVAHEFAHLIFHNHSKEFYSFLTVLMPDWRDREIELNQMFLKKKL